MLQRKRNKKWCLYPNQRSMMMLARETGDRSTGSDNVDLFSTRQRKNIQKYSKIFRNTEKNQKYSKIFNRPVGPDNGSLLHRTNETPIIKCTPSSSHVRIVHHKKRGRILPEKWCSSIFYVKISLCSLPKLEYYNFAIFKRKNLSDIYDIFFSLTSIL